MYNIMTMNAPRLHTRLHNQYKRIHDNEKLIESCDDAILLLNTQIKLLKRKNRATNLKMNQEVGLRDKDLPHDDDDKDIPIKTS